MQAAGITEKTAPLVKLLHVAHPTTPIVLAEGTPDGDLWFGEPAHASQQANNEALKAQYEVLKKVVDANLHYIRSEALFAPTSADFENPTVGGCHPSDLGARDVASARYSFSLKLTISY